jgi:hypothetical protein
MAPPSRRAILRAGGLALCGGLAGCATSDDSTETAPGTDADPTVTPTEAPEPRTPTDSPTDSPTPTREVTLAATSETDTDHTVTVTLTRDGERVERLRRPVPGRATAVFDRDRLPAGTYTVTATLEDGERGTHEWTVGEGRTRLAVVVGDGTVGFEETVENPPCDGTADLPYAAPGAEETFQASTLSLNNDAGERRRVSLSLTHDGERFLDCTYDLGPAQGISLDAVTETAGTYGVTVDVAGGGRTAYDWRIPAGHNWPRLVATVPETGDPLVGCGTAESVDVTVENDAGTTREPTLSLARDGETVAERSVTLDPGASRAVELAIPVGDFYTLSVGTDAGTATGEVVQCYCYADRPTTVTLAEDGPAVETQLLVCE